MRRLTAIWSTFPAEHKRRFSQAAGGYVLLLACLAAWIAINAGKTTAGWKDRIPSASADVRAAAIAPPPDAPPAVASSIMADPQPYVAVIMSGLGLSAALTEQAVGELPGEVTLAFSPYAPDLQQWLGQAARLKRETLIFMPMETASYPQDDPGPRAVSSRLSDQDNSENVAWVLDQGKGAAGVINFMGSRFLTDKKRLAPVFEALRKSDSMFIESPATPKSEARGVAAQASLPYLAVDLQIDGDSSEAAIREQLTKLENISRERGYAIGIAEPYPLTISTLKSWAGGLGGSGVRLMPLKSIWENKHRHDQAPAPAAE